MVRLRRLLGIENLISVKYTTGKELTVALREHLNDYMLRPKKIWLTKWSWEN